MKARHLTLLVSLMLWCVAPGAQAAERELHWDALNVEAHLNADGVLEVIERHIMVFTGDWNGGERVFNLRPRQKLEFIGLERIDARTGSPQPLQETSVPDNVDEFTWADSRTLRWRSRLPSDPPFANTVLDYVLATSFREFCSKTTRNIRSTTISHFPIVPARSRASR